MKRALLTLVQTAKAEVEAYGEQYNVLAQGNIADVTKVLSLLEVEFRNEGEVNERVLRAFKDVCTLIATHYEHTTMFDPVFRLHDALSRYFPGFRNLPLLRMEFGKGEPI
jgi:hypothetical protein